jgi:nucleoside-diphosphate-sugar epimerase
MAYARLAGRQPRWIGLPRALTSALALLAESIAEAAGAAQELPAVARYASEERRYSIDNAKEMLGWSPQIDLETGIESCRAYLTGGQAPPT